MRPDMASENIGKFRGANGWNITGNQCRPAPCTFPGDDFDFRGVDSPEAQFILGFLLESDSLIKSRKSNSIDDQGLVDGLYRSHRQVIGKYPDFDGYCTNQNKSPMLY